MRLNTGQKASAIGHLALIGWVLVGDFFFPTDELPMSFANVSVISASEFASLQEAAAPRPVEEEAAPEPEAEPLAAEQPPEPEPAPEPEPEPEPLPEPEPEPPAEPEPEPLPEAEAPPPSPDPGSTVLEEETETPAPQEADIVAPEETPAPEEDAAEAPEPVEAVTPEEAEPTETPVEEVEPAAPEETTTRIVTEADTPGAGEAGAVESSPRPRARPEQVAEAPAPTPEAELAPELEPEQEPEPEPEVAATDTATEDAIAAAAAAAVAETLAAESETTSEPGGTGLAASGPPLTSGEKDAFRVAVQGCWVIDPGSETSRVTVSVSFQLDQSGKVAGPIELVSASGGSDTAIERAFEAARRAILRCQRDGFPLPPEKYETWRDVTLNFRPDGMRMQ